MHPAQAPYGARYAAGLGGQSQVIADLDFETFSTAGYAWDDALRKWRGLPGADKRRGLEVVGVTAYAQHPSTEVLTLTYNLKDGQGLKRWRPGQPPPVALFDHLARGGLLEAWNVGFERNIWQYVCLLRYGFPPAPMAQWRCAMAKARAHALPGSLAMAGKVLQLQYQKDKDGGRLLDKFSKPRNPTAKDPRRRVTLADDPADGERLSAYCDVDVVSEAEASARVPDLEGEELAYWQIDQVINARGVALDVESVRACIAILQEAATQYDAELHALTGGVVARASELAKLQTWLHGQGVHMDDMTEDSISAMLEVLGPGLPRRALEIRAAVGSASVKKVFAMANQVAADGRLHELIIYHGARTGRALGAGPQPLNLPKAGPDVARCGACGHWHRHDATACPWCGIPRPPGAGGKPWSWEAVDDALAIIKGRSLALLQHVFGDALHTISGCLRGLFTAAPGHELICSDYSAIEAVVTAVLAGEEWRLEVFRTHGQIYEASASAITGVPFDEFVRHKRETGSHHPMRNKIGKYMELACGFGGWIAAAKKFGADKHLSDEEIKQAILKWRTASPAIVELWGGQFRGRPWDADRRREHFGLEGMAVNAILQPGTRHGLPCGVWYEMAGGVLYCGLPSGRMLRYHNARLLAGGRDGAWIIEFEGYNTNPLQGPKGWVTMQTYSGKLTENVVQAVARDILRYASINLEAAGYPVVLHIYDEIAVEVPEGRGSIEDVERIMATLPPWAAGWPIKAAGGWRGKRYRKD